MHAEPSILGGAERLGVWQGAAEMTEREEFFVEVEAGARLWCESIGESHDVVLTTIACWMSADMDDLAEGHRVVFVDPRGRGNSDPVPDDYPLSGDTAIDDLERVRRHLGVDRVSVLGWSAAGAVACGFAMRYPERVNRVVTVGWVPPRRRSREEQEGDMAEASRRVAARGGAELAAEVERLRAEGLDQSDPVVFTRVEALAIARTQVPRPEVFDRMASEPWRCHNEQGGRWRSVLGRLQNAPRPELSGRLGAPTLIVYGDADRFPFGTGRDWRWTMTDARILFLKGVGHYPWLEDPATFFPPVTAFLDGVWPRDAEAIGGRAESAPQ